jgi:hypothetical protein
VILLIVVSPRSIYTLKSYAEILGWFLTPDPINFDENKAWKTGLELLLTADERDEVLPIIFGDAGDAYRCLVAVGLIRRIEIKGEVTTCTMGLVRPLAPKHDKSALVLAQGGQNLSPDDQRNYRIVDTPKFIREALGAAGADAR